MKKHLSIALLGLSIIGFASFAQAAVTLKDFTIKVAEPAASAPAWKAGSKQMVRWNYSVEPSAASLEQVTISFVDPSSSSTPAATFGGRYAVYNQHYGAVQYAVVKSRSIIVPANLAPGKYRIMVTAVSSSNTGSARVSGVTGGYFQVAAAVIPLHGTGSNAAFRVSCSAIPLSYHATRDAVTWDASVVSATAASGASGYTFAWSGAVTGSTASVSSGTPYPTPGTKTAHVKVTNSAGKNAVATCSVRILPKTNASAAVFDALHSYWDSFWPQ